MGLKSKKEAKFTHLLLRMGEIFLKGENQAYFEKKLIENVGKLSGRKTEKLRFRLILEYFPEHKLLKRVFGLTSYSPAVRAGKDLEEIKKAASDLLAGLKGTFRIETRRADKSFPLKSPEVNVEVGKFIEKNSGLIFDFQKPERVLSIEINQDGAYLFLETIRCFGGLPVGAEGSVALLLENKNPSRPKGRGIFNVSDTLHDNGKLMQNNPTTVNRKVSDTNEASILAGLLFMKRGCNIFPVAFAGKGEKDISLLQEYYPRKLGLKLVKSWKEVEDFCNREKINILVSGQNFEDYSKYNTNLLVMRPLISYSQKKIKKELKKFKD